MNFWHDRRGNVAMILALCLIPLLAIAGGAIDMTRQRSATVEAQAALDAAILYVAHNMDDRSESQLQAEAEKVFLEQMKGRPVTLTDFKLVREGDDLTATADGYIDSTLLGLVGISQLRISRESKVRYSERKFEIALALDTTGSMTGDKLARLKSASKLLVDKIEAGTSKVDNRKFALVPFSTWVNVGPDKWNANWIDKDGRSDVSASNLLPRTSRTKLYDALGAIWPGCVEAREYPLDVQDTVPRKRQPETLFSPSFYPDEPDDRRFYSNDYLEDGTSSWNSMTVIDDVSKYGPGIADASSGPVGPKTNNGGRIDVNVAGTKVSLVSNAKKKSNYRYFSDVNTPVGPGYNCATRPIVPLTTNTSLIKSEIDKLSAEGNTNISEGVAWGWRVLSPEKPFRQGRPYEEYGVDKVLVVLSDGNNHVSARSDARGSDYSAYGYAANGRMNISLHPNQTEIWDEMDKRTLEACTNAKKAGLIVYTIRLELKDKRSDGVLSQCASSPEYYLDVPDAKQLDDAFGKIADDILQLYLAK